MATHMTQAEFDRLQGRNAKFGKELNVSDTEFIKKLKSLKEIHPEPVRFSDVISILNNPCPSERCSFTIKTKLPTLNEYINLERKNMYAAASMKKRFTKICSQYSLQVKGQINPNDLYDLLIIWNVTNNKSDSDNIYFGVKFLLDGMVQSGIISGDGRKNIRHILHYIYTKKEYSVEVNLIKVNHE